MSFSPQSPPERQAAKRRAWTVLAADADKLADRLIETDGEQSVETTELRGLLKGLEHEGFPSNEVSARMAGTGFCQTLRALLTSERPRRRVILANAVKAGARGIDELIVDAQESEALAWRVQSGEA